MKKTIKKVGLSLAVFACALCIGVGTALSLNPFKTVQKATAETTIDNGDFYIGGAGLRLINDANGSGLRFHTNIIDEEYDKLTGEYETGTLIIPEIRYDGELTLDDMDNEAKYRPVKIDTTELWYEHPSKEGFMRSTAYIYNIPQKAYGARYVARSYITYEDGTTVYSYIGDTIMSLSDVATTLKQTSTNATEIAQAAPYIVDNAMVTYALPSGDVEETVTYSSTLTAPKFCDTSVYDVVWTDQYGRTWDFATSEITMPVTLTPTYTLKKDTSTVATYALEDMYNIDVSSDNTEAVPTGYSSVTCFVNSSYWDKGAILSEKMFDSTDLTAYTDVYFALKTTGCQLQYGIDGTSTNIPESTEWIYFHLTQNDDATWTVALTYEDGTKIVTLENQIGSTIATLLYDTSERKDGDWILVRGKVSGVAAYIYSTEVIGATTVDNTAVLPADGTQSVQDENANVEFALEDRLSTDCTTEYTGTIEEAAPAGFSNISRFDNNTSTSQGKLWTSKILTAHTYSGTVLSGYTDVWFALKTVGAKIRCSTYSGSSWVRNDLPEDTWVYFHLINTDDVWTIEMRWTASDGTLQTVTLENQSGTEGQNATLCPENSIAAILYGLSESSTDGAYVLIMRTKDCAVNGATTDELNTHIYTTELRVRATESEEDAETETETDIYVPTTEETAAVLDAAFVASSRIVVSTDNTETAPTGYSSVTKFVPTENWSSSLGLNEGSYNVTDISEYSELGFALKTTNAVIRIWESSSSYEATPENVWVYFYLTKNEDATWNITMTWQGADGLETRTIENQIGSTIKELIHDAGTDTATDGTSIYIRANNADAYSSGVVLYSTEIRSVRETWGERVIWSAVDGAAATSEVDIPNGYQSMYQKTNFVYGNFATMDLGSYYSQLKFAFVADTALICRGVTLSANTVYHVTLTREGDNPWNIVISGTSLDWPDTNNNNCLRNLVLAIKPADGVTDVTMYCTEVRGIHIETSLEQQTVALFTNATLDTFDTEEAEVVIDLADVAPEKIAESDSVEVSLNGEVYTTGTIADKKLTFTVAPKDVFGEYTATFSVTVGGRDINVTAPILVVTDLITTEAGFAAVRTILRGADLTEADDNGSYGGVGGAGTMNGDGYYMLGESFALSYDEDKVYAFGTRAVPFVGTFDGNGHYLSGWKNWNNYTGNYQDNAASYQAYLQASLFGRVDGVIKDLALTTQYLGRYANFVHSGSGTIENVYVQYSTLLCNFGSQISPFFTMANLDLDSERGTLRNVVFDFTSLDDSNFNSYVAGTFTSSAGTAYDVMFSVTGRGYTAENVAVYGYDMVLKYTDGVAKQGGVYFGYDESTKIWIATDGAEAGIYAEFANGDNNGAEFSAQILENSLWQMTTKTIGEITFNVPVMICALGEEETTDPSDVTSETGTSGYTISWASDEDGAYDAAQFIRETTKNATTLNVSVAAAEPSDTEKKQIIVGTFDEYYDYLGDTPVLTEKADFGVFLNGNTIFVLAENEEGFRLASEELCRRLYEWNRFAVGEYGVGYGNESGIDLSDWVNYLSYIAFETRIVSGGYSAIADRVEMGFSAVRAPYTTYVSTHNALDYFTDYADSNVFADDGPDSDDTANQQLCYLAHGDQTSFNNMVAHVVGIIVAQAEEDKTLKTINFESEDNTDYCACSDCSAFSNPSITQLVFLNAVAKALAENETLIAYNRTIDVEFFAYTPYSAAPVLTTDDQTALTSLGTNLGISYQTTTFTYDSTVSYTVSSATQTVLKAEDGLRLWWTTHKANHAYALEHEANDHMYLALQGWIAAMDVDDVDVFMYQSATRDLFMPLNTWQYQVAWYNKLDELGLGGCIYTLANCWNDADSQTAFSAFKLYIDSRAMADPSVTYAQLKSEFFGTNGYYGAGGPTMLEFFNELESVMEAKKQTSDYYDPTDYVNDTDALTAEIKLQMYYNGHYMYYMESVFAHWTTYSGQGNQSMFVYSSYADQASTLEAWYSYCTTAAALVDPDSVYATRIGVESWFPEYAFLMLQSTYTSNAYRTLGSDEFSLAYSKTAYVDATKAASDVITDTYEEFYAKVVTNGGMEVMSEYCGFAPTSYNQTHRGGMVTVYTGDILRYGMFYSFFANWGVTSVSAE